MKKVGDMTVNDGGGLFDSEGLCDSMIADCNTAVKAICTGQYVQFCMTVTGIVQKLVNLKSGIKADMDSMRAKVEELKRMNDLLVEQKTGLPVDRDGDDHGSN